VTAARLAHDSAAAPAVVLVARGEARLPRGGVPPQQSATASAPCQITSHSIRIDMSQ